jgi:septum formation protein
VSEAPPLVLASASPRRRELLAELGVAFEVHPSAIDEHSDEGDPARRATALALAKARAVGERAPGALVLGADTIVVAPDGDMLGKPADASEARAMLGALRGRTHRVLSGVAVVLGERADSDCVATTVRMRAYSDAEIDRYVARGEPFDKAGGYAIQDAELAPAASADGCVCSVIGLPLWSVRRLLFAVGGVEASAPGLDRCAACPLRDAPTAGELDAP